MTNQEVMEWINTRLCYGRYTPSIHNPFIKDECFEAGQIAIKALESAEKYKWHDLRKNPEDLPNDLIIVNITWVNHNPESYYADIKDKPFSGASAVFYKGKWYWWSCVTIDYLMEYSRGYADEMDEAIEVIAWKYIEPFESEVEE